MENCKLGISTMSLGYAAAGHDFDHRMAMAHRYGYRGIELFWGDLQHIADSLEEFIPERNQRFEEAALRVYQCCQHYDLEVICLQPFSQFEGLLDREAHRKRIEELHLWLKLTRILRTNMILIPANFLPAEQLSTNPDIAIADLREAALLGLAQNPPVRFAYEALCWSTHRDTWEKIWEAVKLVDLPNFGLCLDTFNIAGRIYADPTAQNGRVAHAKREVQSSIRRLLWNVPVEKIFFVQVVDAEQLDEPLTPSHRFWNKQLPPRMAWSRNCRLFYGEKDRGAYLPVFELCQAIFLDLKFQGWVSFELFNRRMNEEDEIVPEELARRGAVAWQKLGFDMKTQS